MQRFAIYSNEATGLPFWARLYDEGADILVYTECKTGKDVGKNIVPLTQSKLEWNMWARAKPLDTVVFFDCAGPEALAEELRAAGLPVVGTGKFCSKLEGDRKFGFAVAEAAGLKIPEYHAFGTITEAMEIAANADEAYVFKTDRYLEASATYVANSPEELVTYLEWIRERFGDRIKGVLQEKLDGVAISTARWWNGQAWVGPYEQSIEHKKLMDGDVGPSTGCAFNAVWYTLEQSIVPQWDAMTPLFRKNDAPPGIYDLNCMVTKDAVYILEHTPRMGFDSEAVSMRGLELPFGDFLAGIARGDLGDFEVTDDLLWGVRLSISPYPWEHVEGLTEGAKSCIGTPVEAESVWAEDFLGYGLASTEPDVADYYVADPSGLVGIAFARGEELSKLGKSAIESAKALRVPGLQFRTDGAKTVAEDAKKLAEMGYNDLHEGLVR